MNFLGGTTRSGLRSNASSNATARKADKSGRGNSLCGYNLAFSVVGSQVATFDLSPYHAFTVRVAQKARGVSFAYRLQVFLCQGRVERHVSFLKLFYFVVSHRLILRAVVAAVSCLCVLCSLRSQSNRSPAFGRPGVAAAVTSKRQAIWHLDVVIATTHAG